MDENNTHIAFKGCGVKQYYIQEHLYNVHQTLLNFWGEMNKYLNVKLTYLQARNASNF